VDTPDTASDPRRGRFLHVTQLQFWGSLAVSVTVFLFATGPLWRHAADIGRLDRAIFWSYGIIPLLIAGCLLLSRRWSWRGFLLDSMALTLTKYVVTASVAIGLWASGNDPAGVAPRPRGAKAASSSAAEPVITPTPIDPASTGTITVTVADASGKPVEGALVHVSGGLEGLVFAPPAEPVVLTNDGKGVTPALAVVQTGQRIQGRSTDGRLHTLVVRRDGAALFNVPLLSSGDPTPVRAGDTPGPATVRCNVHPKDEAESQLLLVSHPFHAFSDAAGRVTFRGVPSGALRLAAVTEGHTAGEERVQLAAGQTAEARLVVGSHP